MLIANTNTVPKYLNIFYLMYYFNKSDCSEEKDFNSNKFLDKVLNSLSITRANLEKEKINLIKKTSPF